MVQKYSDAKRGKSLRNWKQKRKGKEIGSLLFRIHDCEPLICQKLDRSRENRIWTRSDFGKKKVQRRQVEEERERERVEENRTGKNDEAMMKPKSSVYIKHVNLEPKTLNFYCFTCGPTLCQACPVGQIVPRLFSLNILLDPL